MTANFYLETLYDILDLASALREPEEEKLWVRVLEKLAVAMDAEAATYFLMGPKGRQLLVYYSLGAAQDSLKGMPIDSGKGICGWVASRREPVLLEDAYADPRFLPEVDAATGFKTSSILCVPLMDRLDLGGVLEFINKRGGPFTRDDLRFVTAACRIAAHALRTARQESMLNKVTAHNASILENLTGGFLAVDLRGRVIICNPAARRMLELGEDALNKPVEAALEHLPALADILTKTLTTKVVAKRQDLPWSYKDQKRLLGYSTLLIQDPQGNFTGAGVTFQDLTSLKR